MEITQTFITEQEEKLKQKRKQLVLEIKRLKKQDPYFEESQDPIGRNVDEYSDDASEDTEHLESLQKIKETEELLAKVDNALARIKIGKYGFDENTNEPISIERLKAYPEATTLV